MDTFWATVATVIPVLALAVVLEIRAYSARWLSLPAWIRTIQATIWMAFFSGAVVAMLGVLRALVHDPAHPAPEWLASLSINVVASGIGVLILAPAIELLVRILIPIVGFLRSRHPVDFARVWWLYVRARHSTRIYDRHRTRHSQLVAHNEQLLLEEESKLNQNEQNIRAARAALSELAEDDPQHAEMAGVIERAEKWEEVAKIDLEKGRQLIAAQPADEHAEFERTEAEAKRLREKLGKFSAKQRLEWETLLQSLSWGLNPLIVAPPPVVPAAENRRRRARKGSGGLTPARTRLRSRTWRKQRGQ